MRKGAQRFAACSIAAGVLAIFAVAGCNSIAGVTGLEFVDGGPPMCDAGTACSGGCVDLTSDSKNCGTCGNVCPSHFCAGSRCVSCADLVRNGDETDVDCGGSTCSACADGKSCVRGSDCQSGVCPNGHCAVPTCSDRVKNGNEEGVDCGGSCPLACGGASCTSGGSCQSTVCRNGQCLSAEGARCTDAVECKTLRCVMGTCAQCPTTCMVPAGAPCTGDDNCANGTCDPTVGLCQMEYGAMCAGADECTTHLCVHSKCAYCTDDTQCAPQRCFIPAGYMAGSCTLPSGAYCTTRSAPCASGVCTGFPLKCQ
jgi:hypothetical protein